MFGKISIIEPVLLTKEGVQELYKLGKEVVVFDDVPTTDDEVIKRIGNADCVLSRYSARITKAVLDACPDIKYIGMGCSYYGDKYSKLDMAAARKRNIAVDYLKNYGDEGVAEGIVSQLICLLHGFGKKQWRDKPYELTGQKIGIIGLGITGLMTARALKHFGADVSYYSRTRKNWAEEEGINYMSLNKLLAYADIISIHISRDTVLMHEKEFVAIGNGKILASVSLGRFYDIGPMKKWLNHSDNYYVCDPCAKTIDNNEIINHPKTICAGKIFGNSKQSEERATKQTLDGMKNFLKIINS